MRKDKEKATELRRSGQSYKKISQILGIPTATLCGWFKDLDWSIEIKNSLSTKASFSSPEKLALMVAATRKKFALLHEEYRQEAVKEFPKLKNNRLFVAGLMLYWGEGDKKLENGRISFSNSDPAMIKLFYSFLVQTVSVPIEKISAMLILYPDLIESVQKNLWSKLTKIPTSKFTKSTYIQGRHPTKRNSYGVCLVRVGSRKLKEKMLIWIDLYQKEFA